MSDDINFSFVIDKGGGRPIYQQLEEYIKKNIIERRFRQNSKLPSIRESAANLGISKTTVETGYNQLVVEGYIENKPKKGYFVSYTGEYDFDREKIKNREKRISSKVKFINGGVDKNTIDVGLLKKLYSRVILEENIWETGDVQGEITLRKEISHFVNNFRGGNTNPNQVIVGAGTQYLLGIMLGIIKAKKVAVEEPGFRKAEYIFEDYNLLIDRLKVDDGGLNMDSLEQTDAKLISISPSHQYPLGSVMPINERLRILEWAKKSEALIIEDDYDGIVRYDGKPIPCLQGLDKSDLVIYLGSFSKTLSPSFRISYMIIPNKLVEKYEKIKYRYTQSTSRIDQMVVGKFMEEGHMSKHLRKIRRIYKKKNQLLLNQIQNHYKNKIIVINADSGFHLACKSISNNSGDGFKHKCEEAGVVIDIINERRIGDKFEILYSFSYSGVELSLEQNHIDKLLSTISNSLVV